jgi:Fe-S oxidoreductase
MPGCDGASLTARALAVFDRAHAGPVAILPGASERNEADSCGGYPLLAAGLPDHFRLHAERMARAVAGYERLVVSCPACVHTMKHDYPRFGVPLRPTVEHTSEFLEPFVEQLSINRREGAVYYHDPCYLGRRLGIYDPPRRLAQAAAGEVREFTRAREESECSGGGGLVPLTMPEVAQTMADRRLAQVRESDSCIVVSSCPTCRRQLDREGVRALDLVELLANATDPL